MWKPMRMVVGSLFWLIVVVVLVMPDSLRPWVSSLKSATGLSARSLGALFQFIALALAVCAAALDRSTRIRLGVWTGWRTWLHPTGNDARYEPVLFLSWIAMACFVFGTGIAALFD